ncbi:hypothetical protein BD410DRAFT_784202 [Rickenella mellea]|uniref:Uncharacterized protein n=1 Tax=Rickenella mellea TaxID=50990 RepID=A0A4Y7QFG6_9AGAM|nr:hypothetical protein BD410DRAFT_784202 [Rickenella mellea]
MDSGEHTSSTASTDDSGSSSYFDRVTEESSVGVSPESPVSHHHTGSTNATSPPPSPTRRQRNKPAPLRLQSIGVDPGHLVGKVLTHVRRSRTHPNLTLEFADGVVYQVLVDGYDPLHRGIARALEMDASLSPLFDPPGGHAAVELMVTDCTLVRLTDKAFDQKHSDQRWDQSHLAIAFKFGDPPVGVQVGGTDGPGTSGGDRGEESKWHCVWAALAEYDDTRGGICVFRSYDDVYLERRVRPPPSPRQQRSHRRQRSSSDGKNI